MDKHSRYLPHFWQEKNTIQLVLQSTCPPTAKKEMKQLPDLGGTKNAAGNQISHVSTGDVENHELNFSHRKIGQF